MMNYPVRDIQAELDYYDPAHQETDEERENRETIEELIADQECSEYLEEKGEGPEL